MANSSATAPSVTSGPSTGPYIISRTTPDELLRHDISDEELNMLGDMRRDYLWEGMWVALGITLGVAPASMFALITSYGGEQNIALSLTDLAQTIIFFTALVGFGILCWVMKSKSKIARDLVRKIKDRTKQRI